MTALVLIAVAVLIGFIGWGSCGAGGAERDGPRGVGAILAYFGAFAIALAMFLCWYAGRIS